MTELLLAGILIVEILRLLETPHWSGIVWQIKSDTRKKINVLLKR